MLVLLIMGCCSTETTRDRENSDVCSDIFFNLLIGNDYKFFEYIRKKIGCKVEKWGRPYQAVYYTSLAGEITKGSLCNDYVLHRTYVMFLFGPENH